MSAFGDDSCVYFHIDDSYTFPRICLHFAELGERERASEQERNRNEIKIITHDEAAAAATMPSEKMDIEFDL